MLVRKQVPNLGWSVKEKLVEEIEMKTENNNVSGI